MNIFLIVVTISISIKCVTSNPNPSFPSGSARAHHRSERPHYDEDTEESRCPSPLHSCPILSPHHLRPNDSISPTPVRKPEETGWECVDLEEELTACGSCDNDCTSIPHVKGVGCEKGKCRILSCKTGFSPLFHKEKNGKLRVTSCVIKKSHHKFDFFGSLNHRPQSRKER
ncbi:hypothetical protein MJO29_009694 [Puccinia striiformis f. sp. tritici]|uniref:hypothetical protein n=1 Tax=Puccinia striiformis f. sp. tritici TaxID=168172 RepID=UPI002008BB63|nr:hypothetical protein Pst134EA_017244 [Puccinia striiformis f. sp. tritici]KAH9450642.1 hypothetical protein Pst134EB_018170 [Puccinia striiformis f. sp. tritici]KAH9460934.1 hypothetical protein Pst134EA_017244 [Puccinia striiformis f. sp. tritici]KAI7951020.1 hypothetical protein MJO29_009694 [Puccinia striiformis f. sp. tritici]